MRPCPPDGLPIMGEVSRARVFWGERCTPPSGHRQFFFVFFVSHSKVVNFQLKPCSRTSPQTSAGYLLKNMLAERRNRTAYGPAFGTSRLSGRPTV